MALRRTDRLEHAFADQIGVWNTSFSCSSCTVRPLLQVDGDVALPCHDTFADHLKFALEFGQFVGIPESRDRKSQAPAPKPRQPPSPDSPQAQTVTLSRQFSTLGESSPNRTRASALGGLPGAAPVDSRARSGDLACSKWGGGDSTAVGNVASDIADSPSGAARARQRFRKAVWSGGRPSRKPRHRATRTGHRWRRGQRCQSLRGISHVRYQLQPVLKRDLQLQPDAKSLACMGLLVPKACRLRGPSDANHAAILDCFES